MKSMNRKEALSIAIKSVRFEVNDMLEKRGFPTTINGRAIFKLAAYKQQAIEILKELRDEQK